MLQNPCKTLGFKKNMVYKIPPGGGGKPYPASGLFVTAIYTHLLFTTRNFCLNKITHEAFMLKYLFKNKQTGHQLKEADFEFSYR